MSKYKTNGYLVSLIENASEEIKHRDHADAKTYILKFRALEDEFFEHVHPVVDIGLAISEVKLAGGQQPNIFTVHGCRHISDLIKSLDKFAEAIADRPTDSLTVLEAYILLCAAHVHDAANVSERQGHPTECKEILTQNKQLFVSSVSQQIYDVASVHGGSHPEYKKDTFRSIGTDNSEPPRLPLLAAFLRLGDELSENGERVPELVARYHEPAAMSKLAFEYAKSFKQFQYRKETLFVTYNVHPSQHNFIVTIGDKTISFYEFLESKIDVIDREARYCSQYGRPIFMISQIRVVINLYEGETPSPLKKKEAFTLHLNHGYPDLDQTLCQRAPELYEKCYEKLEDCFVEDPVKKNVDNKGLQVKKYFSELLRRILG
jgi:hypothetical protein